MKQKTILKDSILYTNQKEILLTPMQSLIIKILADELLHTYSNIIKKAKMKRGVFEKERLKNMIYKIKKKTNLDIIELKNEGYFLNQKIYIII